MEEWASVEEILSAQNKVNSVDVNLYGKKVTIYWAELDNSEYPSLIPPQVDKLSDKEKLEFLTKLNDEITIAMIEKGQKMKEAEGGELKIKFTKEVINKLKPRLKNEILTAIWQMRDGINKNL